MFDIPPILTIIIAKIHCFIKVHPLLKSIERFRKNQNTQTKKTKQKVMKCNDDSRKIVVCFTDMKVCSAPHTNLNKKAQRGTKTHLRKKADNEYY